MVCAANYINIAIIINIKSHIMETNTTLSPQDSLRIITETIEKTKSNVQNSSFYFLLWGWLVSIAGITQFILLSYTDIRAYFYVWPIISVIGVIACIVYGFKVERKKSHETYLDSVFKNLWIVIGISFFIIVFIALWLHTVVVPFILLIAGVGTLSSGLIIKFKPMIIGGILFFIFAIGSLFVEHSYQVLVSTLAIITGYLIPGYILRHSETNNK